MAGMAPPGEEVLVQAFVPEPTIERFAERILGGFARCDVVPVEIVVLNCKSMDFI